MDFTMLDKINLVECPDITKDLFFYAMPGVGDKEHARAALITGGRIFLSNSVISAVLAEAEKHLPVVNHEHDWTLESVCDRTVLVCSPETRHNLGSDVVDPVRCLLTNDHRLRGTIVALQLTDFGPIAQYSLTFVDESLLAENVFQQLEIRIKFNVMSEKGITHFVSAPNRR